MTTPVDTIRKMLIAHRADDEGAFRAAVVDLIADERRKSHNVVARELERILDGGAEVRRLRPFKALHSWDGEIPTDGDRGLALLSVVEPRREFDDLVLSPDTRASLLRFTDETGRAELLRARGLVPPTRILLCGPPGCGKTSAAEAIARALLLPMAVVRFDVVVSSYLGETAANLRKIFDFVGSRPMVVLFDEFDAVAKQRDDDLEHGELKRVVNAFLQLLDAQHGDAVFVAATNHHGLLDNAVWRRFDEVVRLDLPDAVGRRTVLTRSLGGMAIDGPVDWAEVDRKTAGLSHADLERIGQMAARQAYLSGSESVFPQILLASIGRYETRINVSGKASSPAHHEGRVGHAIRSGEQSVPAPSDSVGGPESAGKEEARDGRAKARARTARAVRPRARQADRGAEDGVDQDGTAGRS